MTRSIVAPGATVVRVVSRDPAVVLETAADPDLPPGVLLAGLADGPVELLAEPAAALVGRGAAVVLDVGARSGRVVLVRDGVVVRRRAGPGGDHLDAAVAGLLPARCPGEARRVREAASLLPRVPLAPDGPAVSADDVRAALRGPLSELVAAAVDLAGRPAVPVLVVGGVARTPLLAELLDAAGLPDVRVPDRPESAALRAAAGRPRPRPGPITAGPAPPRLGPPPRRAGPLRAVAATLLVLALLAGLHVLGTRVAPAPASADGVLAQYDYALRIPVGWAHTGGLPERRRVLLTPAGAPRGSDLIAVESTPLGYDADAEPARAAAELRDVYDAAGPGTALSAYVADATFAGRAVTAYTEDAGDTTVRWFVLLDGPAQLSVGCRHTPSGAGAVLAACAEVVGSLRRS